MITRLRQSSTAIGIVAGLMMFSGIALAADHQDGVPEDDTLLVVGYDALNGILVTGISDVLSGAWDCTVPAPVEPDVDPLSFDVTYGPEDTDGNLPVTDLTQDGDAVEFEPNPDADDPPEAAVPYPEATNCLLTGTPVAGKNGQINHGQVTSTFAHLLKAYDGKKGCLMRLVAGTEFGKGEQQVKTSDIDPDAPLAELVSPTPVTLENMLTTCQKGNNADKAPKDNPGQLKKAERLAEGAAPGNSGNAKGKNK